MKHILVAPFVILLSGATVWAGEMVPGAQQQPGAVQESPAQPDMAPVKQIEGKISTIDRDRKSVTLDDGTKLLIPDSLRTSLSALKEGATLRAMYEEKDGQKVVTRLTVQPEGRKPKS